MRPEVTVAIGPEVVELRAALICQMSSSAQQNQRKEAFQILQNFKQTNSKIQINSIFHLLQDSNG